MLVQNLQPVKDKLEIIDSKLDELLSTPSTSGLTFAPLTLQPTYQSNSSDGWASGMEPQNLQAIYDAQESTASNLFGIRFDVAWSWGEIIMSPGISIPAFTRINFKVGIRNSGNSISLYELAAFNVSAFSYINIWSYWGAASATQDLIVNVDASVPYIWDKLRFKLTHAYAHAPQARIYDLKVWQIT